MEAISTVTQKGQVTIPASLRKNLAILPYSKVKFERIKNSIKVTKVETLLDIAGTLVPRRNKNLDPVKAREYMEKYYKPRGM